MSIADALNSMSQPEEDAAEKFRQALALFEDGVALQRLKLRRQHPNETAEDIEERLFSWLRSGDEE